MHQLFKRSAVVVASLAVAAGAALVGAPANAAATTVIQVRPADLITVPGTVSGTTGTAIAQFTAEGIHLRTDNQTDGARGYWKVGVPLSQVHAVDYEWFGTTAHPGTPSVGEPAIYYNIDIDGDGKPDGQVIGELAYGGTDVWLNRDAQDFTGVTPTVPANTFANAAPCDNTTARPGGLDTCNPPAGAGSEFHGTLDDWQRRFAASGKTATIVSAGFLANGLIEDGVLRSVTFGPNQYVFTNLAKTKVSLAAAAKKTVVKPNRKVKVKGTVDPAGPGATATLEVKKHGVFTTLSTVTLPSSGAFKFATKAPAKGRLKLEVVVSETNSTSSASSSVIKVKVQK